VPHCFVAVCPLSLTCSTEFGYFQTGSGANQPFSPLISLRMFLNQCTDLFYEEGMTPDIDGTNKRYGGNTLRPLNTAMMNGRSVLRADLLVAVASERIVSP
jgi:hypothetical protein